MALKEASFDARLYLATRRMVERLERPIDLLTGDDNFIYESFVMGAEGALIGFGTLATALQVEMVGLTRQGRWDEARAIWERILPLEEAVYAQPVRDYRARTKIALQLQGVIEFDRDAAAPAAGSGEPQPPSPGWTRCRRIAPGRARLMGRCLTDQSCS